MESLLSWIFPHICLLCGMPVDFPPWIPLCPACAAEIRILEGSRCSLCGRPIYSEAEICFGCRSGEGADLRMHPLFGYRGKAAELLRLYKAGGRRSLAPFWAGLLEPSLVAKRGWTIVPVPPRQEKLRQGKMDQVEAIVSVLERRGWKVGRILVRLASDQQKRLGKEERLRNAEKSYVVSPEAARPLPPKVLILDDVITTGATLRACARALLAAGCAEVEALALAYD